MYVTANIHLALMYLTSVGAGGGGSLCMQRWCMIGQAQATFLPVGTIGTRCSTTIFLGLRSTVEAHETRCCTVT